MTPEPAPGTNNAEPPEKVVSRTSIRATACKRRSNEVPTRANEESQKREIKRKPRPIMSIPFLSMIDGESIFTNIMSCSQENGLKQPRIQLFRDRV